MPSIAESPRPVIPRLRHAFLAACLALGVAQAAVAPPLTPRQLGEDFDAMWRAIDANYPYLGAARAEWSRARAHWRPRAARARSRPEFVAALEGALGRLRDDHVALSERTPRSPRRVPDDTDIWARFQGGAAVVEAVRTFGDADVAGLRPGLAITRIDGVPTERAVREALGGAARTDAQALDWALNHALAGPNDGKLAVEVRDTRGERRLEIERHPARPAAVPPVIGRRMGENRDLGYIRIRVALDDPRLPAQFDAALDNLQSTRALILDVREVADASSHAGTVAILSRFARERAPWQLREPQGTARVADTVAPRGTRYGAPVVVLVDRWTAGEGEALAAGLIAVAGARLVGTPMAGMRGEVREARLPHSGIVLRYPAQKVYHVDGTPREDLRPHVPVDLANPAGGPGDPILYQALKLLEK